MFEYDQQIVDKLAAMGVSVKPGEILTSALATATTSSARRRRAAGGRTTTAAVPATAA